MKTPAGYEWFINRWRVPGENPHNTNEWKAWLYNPKDPDLIIIMASSDQYQALRRWALRSINSFMPSFTQNTYSKKALQELNRKV